ncbi:MAG: VWA domain-containing protein [Acidobacteria bacterium]|nr:VWA domain-containing protein [Acidobacteriota bacterium]
MKPLILTLLAALPIASQIRVDVRLVRILASVKDEAGALVGGLEQKQFRVFDSGVEQQIAIFERGTALPLSVALLIDASGSTAVSLTQEVTSVRTFLRSLLRDGNADDAASLYSFNYETTQLAAFTRRQDRLENGLKRLKGEAGTSVYDAIHFAAHDLQSRDGRKIIVIVTDGGDTTSSYTFRDALQAAHRAEAVIYPIVVKPISSDAGRNVGGENALTSLAQGTGGRVLEAALGDSLDQAFATVLAELRTQYLVAYYPRNLPVGGPAFHPIRLQVDSPSRKLQVYTRTGYYGEAR